MTGAGLRRPSAAVEAAYKAITADGRDGVWITVVDPDQALAAAATVERRLRGGEQPPLAGMTFAVKDNMDVAGLPTTAGCPAFAYVPHHTAPAVQALLDAGAVLVGKTNLDQFATGLVGRRSPYGPCPNAHWPDLIAGGSSSGSAVAVATGMVDLALGTDTAGSGRVPAACNGVVGFKPTRGRISITGIVPACRSIDCVSVFASTVPLAAQAAAIAGRTAPDSNDPWSRATPGVPASPALSRLRIGVPNIGSLDFDGDPDGAPRLAAAVKQVQSLVRDIVEVDLSPFRQAGDLLYGASFVAERYEAVGAFIDAHPDDVDPTVGAIVSAAGRLPAWAAFRDRTELERLRSQTQVTWAAVDVLLVPSVPRVPTVADVVADPAGCNARLGTYTSFVNLLDLAALTLPGPVLGPPDRPPPSVTLIGPAWRDALLARLGDRLMRGRPIS